LNNRLGDNAEMAMIELVDFNELLTKDQSTKKKSRRRGGKKSSSATTKVSENIEEAVIVEETPDEAKEVKSEKPEVNQVVDSDEKSPSEDVSSNNDAKPE
jgi:large subunit ribosomal protein L17